MALTNCKECGREVSSKAKTCPHCGVKVKTGGGAVPIAIVGLVSGCWLAWASSRNGASGSGTDGSTGDAIAAIAQCEAAVTQRLKAPSTADFSGFVDTEVRANPELTQVAVLGHVDSQNGFGAQIRSKYVCFLNGTRRNWAVTKVELE